jgi:hypothetical protein
MTDKPEVWNRLAEKHTKRDDGPAIRPIPEPASAARKRRGPRAGWRTKPGTGAYYLPACAACKMQYKHRTGCPLEHVMHLGRQEKQHA